MPRKAAAVAEREAPAMRLERVPIGDVHEGSGVRAHVDVDEGMVASVRANDIVQPLVVVANGGKGWRLVAGRRRLEAARQAGLATVPVVIREDLEGCTALLAEIVENVQRRDLTSAEKSRAYEQLAAFDLDEVAISLATGENEQTVRAHLRVARSPRAAEASATYDLTISQACVLAEFEDDESFKELTEIALNDPEYLDHYAEQLRQRREGEARRAEAVEQLERAGTRLLEPHPRHHYSPALATAVRLDQLSNANGRKLTPAAHRRCPGHAAFLPASRYSHEVEYYCRDPRQYGHKNRWGEDISASASRSGEERATVIAANKAWKAATAVRLRFVRQLCQRAKAPRGSTMLLYALRETILHPSSLADVRDVHLEDVALLPRPQEGDYNSTLPDGDYVGVPGRIALADSVTSDTAGVLALFRLVATARETELAARGWRSDRPVDVRWLRFLVSEGYTLAEIERQVVDAVEATQAKRRSVRGLAGSEGGGQPADPTGEGPCRVCGRDPQDESDADDWHMVDPHLCSDCALDIADGRALDPAGERFRECPGCQRAAPELAGAGVDWSPASELCAECANEGDAA